MYCPYTALYRPQDFDPPSLARLAFGLASVGYDDERLYTAITQAAADNLDSMGPAEVAMVLWACGEQGHLCHKFMSGRGGVSQRNWGTAGFQPPFVVDTC